MRGTESPRTHLPTVKLVTSFCYLCILFTKGKMYNIQWDRKWSYGVSHFPTLVCISELLQDLSDASIGSGAMLSSVALCSSLSFFGNALQINALYIMQHLICIYNKYFPSFLPDLGLSPMNSFTLWLESILSWAYPWGFTSTAPSLSWISFFKYIYIFFSLVAHLPSVILSWTKTNVLLKSKWFLYHISWCSSSLWHKDNHAILTHLPCDNVLTSYTYKSNNILIWPFN